MPEPTTPPGEAAVMLMDAALNRGEPISYSLALALLRGLAAAPARVRLDLVGWLLPQRHEVGR